MKTLALVSLGCAKNMVDLQVMAGKLLKSGAYTLSPDPDRADVVIVNTCSFIESAREEAESEIRRACALKAQGNYSRVVVSGCYPQRYPQAKAKFPGVDSWQGVPATWQKQQLPGFRLTGKAFAYLKIAEGCSHKCAYCAIPAIRGSFRPRRERDILDEAQELLSSGCRELNIVAQDPMLWHEGSRHIEDLLWKLDSMDGEFWLRVLYSYPNEISPRFLDWMANARHAVKYIDVPLQHTVPAVLKRMHREAAIPATRDAAARLRAAIPDVTLRTTIMTGFPGETPLRFSQLMQDLERMQFDRLGAFAYSPEEGTAGAAMKTRASHAVALEREHQVMALGERIWRKKSRSLIGAVSDALVIAPGVARLPSQAPDVDGVTFVDSQCVGKFIRVRITRAKSFDFFAEVV